eukprot:PhF_6_TR6207/c0_g1_i1/m.9340
MSHVASVFDENRRLLRDIRELTVKLSATTRCLEDTSAKLASETLARMHASRELSTALTQIQTLHEDKLLLQTQVEDVEARSQGIKQESIAVAARSGATELIRTALVDIRTGFHQQQQQLSPSPSREQGHIDIARTAASIAGGGGGSTTPSNSPSRFHTLFASPPPPPPNSQLVAKLEGEKSALRAVLETTEKSSKSLQASLSSKESQLYKFEQKITYLQSTCSQQQQELSAAYASIRKLTNDLSDATTKNKYYEDALNTLTQRNAQLEREAHHSTAAQPSFDTQTILSEMQSMKQQLTQLQAPPPPRPIITTSSSTSSCGVQTQDTLESIALHEATVDGDSLRVLNVTLQQDLAATRTQLLSLENTLQQKEKTATHIIGELQQKNKQVLAGNKRIRNKFQRTCQAQESSLM